MILFLATILLVYGGVHLYTFLRIKSAVTMPGSMGILLAVMMLLMVCSLFIIHLLEQRGFEKSAMIFSQTSYFWMGLIFLFFVISLTFDFYRLLIHIVQWCTAKDYHHLLPSAGRLFYIPLIVALGIFIYAYFEALNIRTEHLKVASEKIPAEIGTLRIVQISDVHIGLMVREARLKGILAQVKSANPDLVVCTGDLLDGQTDRTEEMALLLKEIQPKYGKFAVMGNHEYYSGFAKAHLFFDRAGFTLLRGEGKKIAGYLNLIGFDDPAANRIGLYKSISESYLKENFTDKNFMLFLKHQPVVEDGPAHFDLQLSGHTHDGQIFPFRFLTALVFPMNNGLFKVRDNGILYVSRGSGTWGPPIRFLAPPEVTVIDLVHK